jgi:predicted ArsR family transcriptional regulator
MTRTRIRDLFGRHENTEQISKALEALLKEGFARRESVATAGRPQEVWYSTLAT